MDEYFWIISSSKWNNDQVAHHISMITSPLIKNFHVNDTKSVSYGIPGDYNLTARVSDTDEDFVYDNITVVLGKYIVKNRV